MFSASKLTPEQVEAIRQLAANGATLPDIQRHLKEDQGISITYMDTRFLVLDLNIQLVEESKEEPKKEEPASATPPAPGEVTVTMDQITLPGALISGKVTFSDGETAIWMIDSNGRPGLDPDTAGYRPSQEDVLAFQTQLRAMIEKQRGGF